MSLADARKEAKAILGAVGTGGDPVTERRKAQRAKSETLEPIVDEYWRRKAAGCAP